MYDPTPALEFLDEQGIHAQVLYPNVGGFGNGYFTNAGRPRRSSLACVQAYNDFLTDWCSAAPDRLIADHRAAVLGRRPRRRRAASAASTTATGP